jgi:hypothetical protein
MLALTEPLLSVVFPARLFGGFLGRPEYCFEVGLLDLIRDSSAA